MAKKEETKREHKVLHRYNYVSSKGDKTITESKTTPNLSLPVQTILERYTRGMPLNVAQNTPIYDEEGEEKKYGGIDFRTLDLAEKEQIIRMNKIEIEYLMKKFEDEKQEKIQKKRAATTTNPPPQPDAGGDVTGGKKDNPPAE